MVIYNRDKNMNTNQAKKLAEDLIRHYDLVGWNFKYDKARRRFGCCNYKERTISLSLELTKLNDEAQVKDTLLHEIAHAIVGSGNGHNWIWKGTAKEIGCSGERCYNEKVVKPKRKYIAVCPSCKIEVFRDRVSSRTSCGKCDNKFNEKYLLIFKENI